VPGRVGCASVVGIECRESGVLRRDYGVIRTRYGGRERGYRVRPKYSCLAKPDLRSDLTHSRITGPPERFAFPVRERGWCGLGRHRV
jgi:hypothetical protein